MNILRHFGKPKVFSINKKKHLTVKRIAYSLNSHSKILSTNVGVFQIEFILIWVLIVTSIWMDTNIKRLVHESKNIIIASLSHSLYILFKPPKYNKIDFAYFSKH